MCGICGIIHFDDTGVQESSILNMMQLMKHRGPDDEGVFIEKTIGLGFVRLSIIDLTKAGHQPKLSLDERYVIVFNGEIYNYIELREELQKEGVHFITKTDTEVLLNAYIRWGEDCMHRFNGMWAIAIYDRQKQTVFCARDRYGIKPFYYLQTETFFAFCSEIPPLLLLIKDKPNPNYQTIFDFLVFNRTDQTEKTFFEEVNKLQHGNKLTINIKENKKINSRLSIVKWYDIKESVNKTIGFESPHEFKELFTSSIELRLRSDVPVGVCLSGGLDSSSIVSIILNEFDKNELKTFSAVYNKGQLGDEKEFIDEYKSLISNMSYITPSAITLKNDLEQFIKAHGEPIPTTGPYAQFKVMKLAKGNVVVTLDGQGADEELAGYHYFFGFYFKDLLIHFKFAKLCNEIFCYLKIHKNLIGIKSFLFFLLPKYLRTRTRVNEKKYLNEDFVNKYKNSNSIVGNLYSSKSLNEALFDHFEYKLEHLLKWEDRNSMFFSIEARVPFLDYRIVEKLLATRSDLKIKKGMTKFILREAMKGILPKKIYLRSDKIGFDTPEDEWFRDPEWQDIVHEILNSQSFINRNLINNKIAFDLYKKHLNKEINISKEIWKWIHLEFWFRQFID